MIILQTPRLVLREAKLTDAPFILRLYNEPDWIKNIGDRGIHSLEDAQKQVGKMTKSYLEHGFGFYVMSLRENEKPIGVCGLIKREFLEYHDLGFGLLSEYEGKGLAFEAAKDMMDYAFTKLNFSYLQAITIESNSRSRRLLEKLGMKHFATNIEPGSGDEIIIYQIESGIKEN